MPLIKVHYPTELKPGKLHSLSSSLTELTAEALGKSSDFVMTVFQKTELQSFGSDIDSPSLFIEVKNVGSLPTETTSTLSSKISELCSELIKVQSSRIYIDFQESPRHLWGWNGKTFLK
jgi:phenylpyruvate tautomerase PptA (4-oxalocrotonate tautomerase family)